MYPRIPWELVADPSGSVEHTVVTTVTVHSEYRIVRILILSTSGFWSQVALVCSLRIYKKQLLLFQTASKTFIFLRRSVFAINNNFRFKTYLDEVHDLFVGRDFPHPSRLALGPTQPLYKGYRVAFPEVKRLERDFSHPPASSAEVKD